MSRPGVLERPTQQITRWASKDNAAPSIGVPAVANSANHRCRRYDWRCHHSRPRYDYDRPPIRLTSSIRPTVKAWATSTLSTGTVDGDK
jgi:hypothetical protein